MARLQITGTCPRCGSPIFSETSTENPEAVRTCPSACDFRRPTPEERQLQEADEHF